MRFYDFILFSYKIKVVFLFKCKLVMRKLNNRGNAILSKFVQNLHYMAMSQKKNFEKDKRKSDRIAVRNHSDLN